MKWKCEECGREYSPIKTYQRFCDNECRKNWHLHQYHVRKETKEREVNEILQLVGLEEAPAEPKKVFARRY